jgi:hypothetical protein
MKTHIIVSYDLISPGQHYKKVAEAIKSLGEWTKVLESLWYVRTDHTLEESVNVIWASMDSNDKLFVTEISDAAWRNLLPEPAKLMQAHWRGDGSTGCKSS